jgi:phosphate uptake regulator
MQIFSLKERPASRDQEAFSVQGEAEEVAMADLHELGKEARRVLGATMKAFAARDASSATLSWQGNMIINQRYEHLQDEMIALLTKMHTLPELRKNEEGPRRIAYLLLLAQRLMRIADHCNTICERTVFIAEGITRETLEWAS